MKKNENRLSWPDNLRATAAIAVILLHVAAPVLYKYPGIGLSKWWIGNIFDSAVRFCVPVFLMLTGALLLPKTHEWIDFIKRRFSRLLYPFLLWSIIYLLYNFKWEKVIELNSTEVFQLILDKFKKGTSYHLWYVYMTVFFYFFIPLISKWIKVSSLKVIMIVLILWYGLVLLNLSYFISIKNRVDLLYFTSFIGYPVLGYVLSKYFEGNKIKTIAIFIYLIGFIITFVGTYLMTKSKNHFYGGYYFYLTPNVLIASIGVFLYFKKLDIKSQFFEKGVQIISKYSYGIYLSHVLILSLLTEIGITWMWIHPVFGIIATSILCLILSTGLVYLISKLPFGNYISG
jgi:surface polysaccharide O-acyltransferase-like enzyme